MYLLFLYPHKLPCFLGILSEDIPLHFDLAIKVFFLFRNGQSPFPAHLVRKLLHPLQISFRTVQLSPIFITDRIRHQMAMNVVFDSEADIFENPLSE